MQASKFKKFDIRNAKSKCQKLRYSNSDPKLLNFKIPKSGILNLKFDNLNVKSKIQKILNSKIPKAKIQKFQNLDFQNSKSKI